MAALTGVIVEPGLVVHVLGGRRRTPGAHGDQMRTAIAGPQRLSHCAHDPAVVVRLDRAVAAHDPDDGLILVPPADVFAKDAHVLGREDLGPDAPLLVPLVAPGREQTDVQAQRRGVVDHGVACAM